MRKRYSMPRSEAIKEHKRLITILRKGSRRSRSYEAYSQSEELKKIKRR